MAMTEVQITGSGKEDPTQILANPWNWRIHQQYQREALTGVLREVGLVQEVTINTRTGHLVDGHLRVEIALDAGEPEIDVKYLDVDEQTELAILATKDPMAALIEKSEERLRELVERVQPADGLAQQAMAEVMDLYLTRELPTPPVGEAEFIPHPFADKAPTKEERESGAAGEPLHPVYFFMSQAEYVFSLATLKVLAQDYGTESMGETAVRAIREEAERDE
jgi:hypothetical protein